MKKYLPWILGLMALLAIGYFVMRKKSSSPGAIGKAIDMDTSLPESKVQTEISWMKNDPATVAFIKKKAQDNGVSYEQQLRWDAEWYVKKNLGI